MSMPGIATGVMAYNRTARRTQQVRWHYNRQSPLTVTAMIPALRGDADWIEWILSRQTIGDAFISPQDVPGTDAHMKLEADRFLLTLRPDAPDATVLSLPSDQMWEFLTSTHKIVPPCRHRGQCTGIGRDDCPECWVLDNQLDATLIEICLNDEGPF